MRQDESAKSSGRGFGDTGLWRRERSSSPMPETTSGPTTYRLSTKKTSIPANSVSPSSAVRIIRPTATALKARPRYTV
jgi:hypothetical protein